MKKLLFFLALLFLSVPGWGANYYVRTDGHDTASGVNDTNNATTGAFRTIGKGATVASAGDMVIINDGTYAEGLVSFSRSGSAGNMIYFRAANNRQAQLIGGIKITGNFVKVEGLKIAYTSGITNPAWASGNNNEIRNNWIENGRGHGALYASGSNNILDSNYLTNPQIGIILSGNNNIASNNEINGLTFWSAGVGDADHSRVFGTNNSFIRNYFHGADLPTLNPSGAHVDCFQTFDNGGSPSSFNILFDGNRCDTAHQGFMLSADVRGESSGITIRNNIMTGLTSWCALIWNITDVYFYNNVFANNTLKGIGTTTSNGFNVNIVDVKNNIWYNGAHPTEAPYAGNITNKENNLLYKNTGGSYSQGTYPNDIVNIDPNFVSSTDFHLQTTSVAIDDGTTIATFSTDRDGTSRPQGSAWDIGAYELIKITPVIPLTPKAPEIIRVN